MRGCSIFFLAAVGMNEKLPPSQLNLGPTAANGKSRIAAALFALLLGGIGVHKFYLGQIGMGIVYLLFCWTFIPALIAFIEGIIYLIDDERRKV